MCSRKWPFTLIEPYINIGSLHVTSLIIVYRGATLYLIVYTCTMLTSQLPCHREKKKMNISHLSCGHEIWHFIDLFSTNPVEDRVKCWMCMTFGSILYKIGGEQVNEMSDFMSTGQMGNFIFRPVCEVWHTKPHPHENHLEMYTVYMALFPGLPCCCFCLFVFRILNANWRTKTGRNSWRTINGGGLGMRLKYVYIPIPGPQTEWEWDYNKKQFIVIIVQGNCDYD